MFSMPRNLRVTLPEVAYHVTQRGVDRMDVFDCERDRLVYLGLAADLAHDAGVRMTAYCLMRNHVHWIVTPERGDSLAVFFRRVHGRYAQYFNAARRRIGSFENSCI
jgi:putative transposase